MQICLDGEQLTVRDEAVTDDWQLRWAHQPEASLHSTVAHPAIAVGDGDSQVKMNQGNFQLHDTNVERIGLPVVQTFTSTATSATLELAPAPDSPSYLRVLIHYVDGGWHLDFKALAAKLNRFWLRLTAQPSDRFYGGGEQMSYLNLAGRTFPIWTSEPGVGRNKQTAITQAADRNNGGGGDYYTSNYPQATYLTSRHQMVHLATTAYAELDFTDHRYTELSAWAVPDSVWLASAPTLAGLVRLTKDWFGTQPVLPDWANQGVVLGLQGGTQVVGDRVAAAQRAGIKVAGVWLQDWEGPLFTSFGKRLHWDWHWDQDFYPGLDEQIANWRQQGIRFLGYINPYVVEDGPLFATAKDAGYLATKADGDVYLVDFGEFNCGVVDLLNPAAYQWYQGIIEQRLIDFDMSGWMADFGEYLPTDVQLAGKADPMLAHNQWPVLWAKLNHDALEHAGKLGEVVPFFRAGGAGTQGYAPLLWAGDQSVDWTPDDGLPSALTGMLTVGLTGNGLTHPDIGGYTSLFGNVRTKELWLRWLELGAFTPFMRTHEGNRPSENFQYYDDYATMRQVARLTRVHQQLAPYLRAVMQENTATGMPVMRPLVLTDEEDEQTWDEHTSYTLGSDLLVAPVLKPGETQRSVYLPGGEWCHLWSGELFRGQRHVTVAAPMGMPPVFYRASSSFANLFSTLR